MRGITDFSINSKSSSSMSCWLRWYQSQSARRRCNSTSTTCELPTRRSRQLLGRCLLGNRLILKKCSSRDWLQERDGLLCFLTRKGDFFREWIDNPFIGTDDGQTVSRRVVDTGLFEVEKDPCYWMLKGSLSRFSHINQKIIFAACRNLSDPSVSLTYITNQQAK